MVASDFVIRRHSVRSCVLCQASRRLCVLVEIANVRRNQSESELALRIRSPDSFHVMHCALDPHAKVP